MRKMKKGRENGALSCLVEEGVIRDQCKQVREDREEIK